MDRIFPLCELLLGAAYADGELRPEETREIRALLIELAGEHRVEVEACIASFDPAKFDPRSVVGYFRDDPEPDRQRLLRLVCTVIEADEEIDFRENDYLRAIAAGLGLPATALVGLVIDIELDDMKDDFQTLVSSP